MVKQKGRVRFGDRWGATVGHRPGGLSPVDVLKKSLLQAAQVRAKERDRLAAAQAAVDAADVEYVRAIAAYEKAVGVPDGHP